MLAERYYLALFPARKFDDLCFGLRFQRLMPWLLVPEDLAQVALVHPLAAVRAIVEMTLLANEIARAACRESEDLGRIVLSSMANCLHGFRFVGRLHLAG